MSTTVSTLKSVFTADTKSLDAGMARAKQGLSDVATVGQQKLSSLTTNLNSFANSIIKVATPIAGLFTVATKNSLDFERAMLNAFSIIGATGDEADRLYDIVLDKGGKARAGPQQVALAYYDIVSGIADVTSHMAILDASIATSEAGQSDLKATTNALIGVMNAYGLEASDAAHVSDVFTRTVQSGVLTMDELAASFPKVTSLAAANDIRLEELAGALAFMTKTGVRASEATTRLQGAMIAILKPNQDMKDALAELGYKSGEALLQNEGLIRSLQLLAGTSVTAEVGLSAVMGRAEALQAAIVLTKGTVIEASGSMAGFTAESVSASKEIDNLSEKIGVGFVDSIDGMDDAIVEKGSSLAVKMAGLGVPIAVFTQTTIDNAKKFGPEVALALEAAQEAIEDSFDLDNLITKTDERFQKLGEPVQIFTGKMIEAAGDIDPEFVVPLDRAIDRAVGFFDRGTEHSNAMGDSLSNIEDFKTNSLYDAAKGTQELTEKFIGINKFMPEFISGMEGSTSAALGIQESGAVDDWDKMKSTFQKTSIILGKQMEPALIDAGEAMIPIMEKVGEWINRNPKLTAAIGLGTLGLLGLAAATYIATTAVGAITAVIGIAGVVGSGGATLVAAFMALGPAGWAAAAGIAVAGGAALAYKEDFLGFKTAVDQTAQSLYNAVEALGNWITAAGNQAGIFNNGGIDIPWSTGTGGPTPRYTGFGGFGLNANPIQPIYNPQSAPIDWSNSAWSSTWLDPQSRRGGEPPPSPPVTGQNRDIGGPGIAGQTYLIGRQAQPELFTPGVNGTFIPNFDRMGGQTIIFSGDIYINDSDDPKKTMDRLLEEADRRGGRRFAFAR